MLAGFVAQMLSSEVAWASPDITVATIATGRLYVAGNVDRPRTPVMLDNRFRTESDETGRFQFEEIYHPARCIVGVQVDDRTYEAVVGNCGQQGPRGEPGPASVAAAVVQPGDHAPTDAPGLPRSSGNVAVPTPPANVANAKLSPVADQPQAKRRPAPPPRPKVRRPLPPPPDAFEPADIPSSED